MDILKIPATRPEHRPLLEPIAAPFTDARRQQDLVMLNNPVHWPHAVLPLKRYVDADGAPILTRDAMARARDQQYACWDGAVLYRNTLCVFGARFPVPDTAPTESTISPEQVVDEGWTVD